MTKVIHIFRKLLAGILFIVVLELCARLDDYFTFRAPILGVYNSYSLYEHDELGLRGKPFGRYRKWRLNELGYRGPGFEKDHVHLVTFGASETFGLYESKDGEYPRQLERELNAHAHNPPYQVINVAYPGQTIPSATARVPEIVARIRPKLALIYPSFTSYIDNPRERPKGSAQEEKQPVFEFRIVERLQNVAKALLPQFIQTDLRRWEIRHSIGSEPAIQHVPDEAITRFRKDLFNMITKLRASGVRPVLITHATIFGTAPHNPDHAILVAWRKFYPRLNEEGFLDLERRMNEAMRELASQQNVPLVDVARHIPPGQRYFADFVHLTDIGAALMAKELAEAIGLLLQEPPMLNTRTPSACARRSGP
jgi:lysophospholipase L1-like esterase